MKITLQHEDGLKVYYDTDRIAYIRHDKASNLYNKSDLAGNGIKATESVLVINFKNGECATFGDDWSIIF